MSTQQKRINNNLLSQIMQYFTFLHILQNKQIQYMVHLYVTVVCMLLFFSFTFWKQVHAIKA